MRREFLTGFYGSAGDVVITVNKAILWTDGRYHIQADHQLDCNWILMRQGQLNVNKPLSYIFISLIKINNAIRCIILFLYIYLTFYN